MERDLNKIKNIAKEKEDENWRFRYFLKVYDSQGIDTIVHKLFKQVSEKIDCTTCGNCCRTIQPSVKKKDIKILSKSLKITPDQFITCYVNEDENGEKLLRRPLVHFS